MKTTRLPGSGGYVMDSATDAHGDRTPAVGDVTLCLRCASVLAFMNGMALRLATDDDMAKYGPTARKEIAGYQAVIRTHIARRN